MSAIRLQSVTKVYDGGIHAVRSVDLDVESGEFVVLVGPSGCGKSTILRMIAGLESITSGELFVDGERMNDVQPRERDVAMVFQNYALYPHMSVAGNMGFGLKLRGTPKAEIKRRVRETADLLGMDDLLERRPSDLSGGQRQRVALGRAIVRKPKVFLFDEPLSNLDARLRVQMRMELSRLHQRLGTTMVYVTHDQVEAMTMGERIVIMDGGRVQQVDAPLNVYAHPANRFVAGFIGSPGMNFMEGHLANTKGKWSLECPSLGLTTRLSGEEFHGLTEDGSTQERDVLIGLRPEHVRADMLPGRPHGVMTGSFRVDLIEPMGNEIVLHASRNGISLVARMPPREIPGVGYAMDLGLDMRQAHFFDGATGLNLRPEPARK